MAPPPAASTTRVVPFEVDGKRGHLSLEDAAAFEAAAAACAMPLLAELRDARLLDDRSGLGARLVADARLPMPDDVRLCWFRFHYVEMRSSHRTADNTLARAEPVASLIAVTGAMAHALRAGMVLDRALERARGAGLEGPWLERWCEHIPQARAGAAAVRWPGISRR